VANPKPVSRTHALTPIKVTE